MCFVFILPVRLRRNLYLIYPPLADSYFFSALPLAPLPKFFSALKSQIAMSKKGQGGRRTLPYAFSEHGAVMAANILNSDRAVQMSIFVVRAFIKMRQTIAANKALTEKLEELEKKITGRLDVHEKAIVYVLGELKKLMEPPKLPEPKRRPIGFG